MELYKEILATIFEKEEIRISFPNLADDITEVIKNECYIALQKIKTIIDDNNLSDFECVEEIVCVFEKIGISGGSRHDFG